MVKLFIGNLAESVDSTKIKQIFQPFTQVSDCDVVKNYAFIRVPDEDAQDVMKKLDGYILDGKAIQIKVSTSKLRSVPGLTSQHCLRCTSTQHRTPQCPEDPANQISQTIKIDLTRGTKREGDPMGINDGKRQAMMDQEIPRPDEPDLQQLYEEYNTSRQRYTYYRDRLIKEIEAKRGVGNVFIQPMTAPINNTQLSSAPVQYLSSTGSQYNSYTVPTATGSHPYSHALKAPYMPAGATASPAQAPYGGGSPYSQTAPPPNPSSMTTQQYIQQTLHQAGSVPPPVPATSIYGQPYGMSSAPYSAV